MKRKRGVLSVWATLALVFVGMAVIAGATVLSLFLMGKFNDEGVAPGDDLTFVMTSGLGHQGDVDADGSPVFYISEDSFFEVQTGVEDVTEKELRLYFDTSVQEDVASMPGYITDGIIIVRERAQIGERIEVLLAEDVEHVGFPKGGISTLYVSSPTNPDSVTDRKCKIVVDVPVEKEGFTGRINGQTKEEQEVVVSVPSFEIIPTFTPEKSGYYFADSTKPRLVFFSILSQKIVQEDGFAYNEFKPTAVTSGTPEVVRLYTFKNSEYQLQFLTERDLTENSNRDELNEAFQDYRLEHGDQVVSNDIEITIQGVSVTGVTVGADSTLEMRLDKNFHLTTKRPSAGQKDFGTLDILIAQGGEASSEFVNALYANVGIRVPTEQIEGGGQKVLSDFKISGGKVIEVDKSTWAISEPRNLTIEEIDAALQADTSGNKLFYVLPYTRNIVSADDYYWNISTAAPLSGKDLVVNFFEEKASRWQAFFKFEGETNKEKDAEQTFSISGSLPEQRGPRWKSEDAISLVITASTSEDAGNSARVNLPSLMEEISTENVYRTMRYFLILPTGNADKVADFKSKAGDYFDQIGPAQTYTKYYNGGNEGRTDISISGVAAVDGVYTLFEFTGNYIIARKELPLGLEFSIVAFLVRTDADGNVVRNTDGTYQVINNSPSKIITVDSTLSIKDMKPTFSIDDATYGKRINSQGLDDASGDYYIPSMIRDAEGNPKDILTFNLTLSNVSEVPGEAEDKLISAYNNGKAGLEENGTSWLTVVAMDQTKTRELDYITLSSFRRNGEPLDGATEIEYTGTLSIKEEAFSALKDGIDNGTYIALELKYYDGKEVRTTPVVDAANVDHFYIYYQQPQSITFNGLADYEKDNPYVSIEVDAGSLSITWGQESGAGAKDVESVSKLQELISFTLNDKFGRVIEPQLGYKLRLDEVPGEGETAGLLSFNDDRTNIGTTFRSTSLDGEKTTLVASVVDASGNYQTGNGTEGGTRIECATKIKFFIKSVGLKTIKRDVSTGTDHQLEAYTNLQPVLSSSMVEVRKYVTTNTQLILGELVEFYTSSSDTEPVKIKINVSAPFYNNLIQSQITDLQDMLTFDTNINFGLRSDIKSVTFKHPFGDDTYFDFTVTDEGANLFSITLRLYVLSNITMSPSFDNYASNEKIPSKYLVKSAAYPNASPVFAGAKLDFDTYMPLTVKTGGIVDSYAWNKDVAILDEGLGVTLHNDDTKPSILIDELYTFSVASFTIYYEIQNQYALHQTVTLYVNPDILVAKYLTEEGINPYVDIDKYFGDSSSSTGKVFGIYSLTNYIKNNMLGDELELECSLDYTGEEGTQFITMQKDGDNNDKFVFVEDKNISLYYGQKLTQEYDFKMSNEREDRLQGATISIIGDNMGEVTLGTEGDAITIAIDFGIDQETGSESIIYQGEVVNTDAPVVKYNNDGKVQTYVMIEPNMNGNTGYYAKDGYTISSATGILIVQGTGENAHLIISGAAPFLSAENNSFVATTKFTDSAGKTLTVSLTVNAIITGMGKDNVYYHNGTESEKDMTFNAFTNEDGEEITYDVLIGDWEGLVKEKVYQELDAGKKYTIAHDLKNEEDEATRKANGDVFGFYYHSVDGTIPAYLTIIKATADGKDLAITENNTKCDLATIEDNVIMINHLSDSVEAYLILQLTLREAGINGRTFTWYYRIKITPSFAVGQPTYPYGNDGEYLDEHSSYYIKEEGYYQIPLHEEYNYENSGRADGQRFGNIKFIKNATAEAKEQYEIASVYLSRESGVPLATTAYSEYFEYDVTEGNLKVKVKTDGPLTIYLRQYYTLNGMRLLGSDQVYILRFNQMSGFEHKLSYDQVEGADKHLQANEDIYDAKLVQGLTGVFTPEIEKKEAADRVSNYLDFVVYINGSDADLKAALKPYVTIKKGAVGTYAGEENHTFEEGTSFFAKSMSFDDASKKWTIVDKENKTTVLDEQYVTYAYVKIELNSEGNRKTLTFEAQDSITKDYAFDVGVCSDEEVIFKIQLTVTSIFTYKLNSDFNGGAEYAFVGEKGIIKSITEKGASTFSRTVKFELEDNQRASFGNEGVMLADLVDIKEDGKLVFAELLQDVTFKFVVKIYGEADAVLFQFPISILVKGRDVTATNQFTDNRREFSGYAFEVKLDSNLNDAVGKESIQKTFGLNALSTITDGKHSNGYTLLKGNATQASVTVTPADASSDDLKREETLNIGYYFKNKLIFEYEFTFVYYVDRSVTLTPNYPDPDGETRKGTLSTEYIGTTAQPNETYLSAVDGNFFNNSAMFAQKDGENAKPRVEQGWTDRFKTRFDADHKDDDPKPEYGISAKNYSISISSIDAGLTVYVNGETFPKPDQSTIATQIDNLRIQFSLEKGIASANVVFNVTLNGISTEYSVTVIQGDVIKLLQTTTNYDRYDEDGNQAETIYVEDLNKYLNANADKGANLFAQNRLAVYKLLPNQVGQNLFARYVDLSGQAVVIQLDSSTSEKITYDMGRSLSPSDYTFDAIYGQNSNGNVSNRKENAEVFDLENDGEIKITSRLTAYYFETEIAGDITIERRLKNAEGKYVDWVSETGANTGKYKETNVENIVITKAENYEQTGLTKAYGYLGDHIVRYSFGIKYNGQYYSQIDYTIRLATELLVENNANEISATDSLSGLPVQEISAGASLNLLSMSGFGFKNARTKLAISKINDSAKIGLNLYGFADAQIKNDGWNKEETQIEKDLSTSAYNLHTYLRSVYANADSAHKATTIDYYTGLAPRYGMETLGLNTDKAEGSAGENYLMYYGQNEKDYKIKAQHCTNDGNYVMIRMEYTVNWGPTDTVNQYNNLLFKVIPGNNMSVEYKDSPNAATYSSNSLVGEIRDGRTYVSNINNPYTFSMGISSQEFFLAGNDRATDPTYMSIIRISKGTDPDYSASSFTYTYTTPGVGNYNSFAQFAGELIDLTIDGTQLKWEVSTTGDTYIYTRDGSTGKVAARAPIVNLGTKKMYITYEDKYGYRGIFYFDIQTTGVEPGFADNSTLVLTEGEEITFSVAYQNVVVDGDGISDPDTQQDAKQWIMYQPLDYAQEKNTVVVNDPYNNTITGYRLTATLNDGRVFTKTKTDAEQKGNEITITIWKQTSSDAVGDNDAYGREKGTPLDKDWELNNGTEEKPGLTQSELEKASIVFGFSYTKNLTKENVEGSGEKIVPGEINPDTTKMFTATYGGTALIQTHTVGQVYTPTKDDLNIKETDVTPIAISGIGAYAYNVSLGTVDSNAVETAKTGSKFIGDGSELVYGSDKFSDGEITVEKVDFVLKNDEITPAYNGSNVISSGSETTLLAGKNKFFVSSSGKLIQGSEYVEGTTRTYTVPYIKGYLYALGNQVSGIEMLVTLKTNSEDPSNEETQIIKRDVVITKKGAETPFDNSVVILDGESAAPTRLGDTTYNNTLEVVVEPNTKASVTISSAYSTTPKYDPATNNIHWAGSTTFDVSNDNNFAVTKYLRIVGNNDNFYDYTIQNITGESEYGTLQFVATTSVSNGITLKYNGELYDYKAHPDTQIAKYESTITLRINDPTELSGNIRDGAAKTEKLYFLYNNGQNEELYRQEPDFRVSPFVSTLTKKGNVSLDKYLKVDNDGSYYVIPYNGWATQFKVKNSKNEESPISAHDAYKFHFDIDADAVQGGGQGGAAYIDERGTITTTTAFNPNSDGIAVNVYANISGNDGMYENDIAKMTNNDKMFLGTANLTLQYADSFSGNPYRGGSAYIIGASDDAKQETLVAGGGTVYSTSSSSWGTLTSIRTTSLENNPLINEGTFTAGVGEKIDLRQMLASATLNRYYEKGGNNWEYDADKVLTNNKHYHVISVQETSKEGSPTTYIPYNNVDYYTFTGAGTYTLTIMATGRRMEEAAIKNDMSVFNIEMIVYSSGASALKYTKVVKDGATFTLNNLDSNKFNAVNAEGEPDDKNNVEWFRLDKTTGSMTPVTGGEYTPSTLNESDKFAYGLNKRSFLAQVTKDGVTTTHLVDVDFWIYDNAKTANTDLLRNDTQVAEKTYRLKRVSTTRANYNLANLFAPQTKVEADGKTYNYSYTIYSYVNADNYDEVGGAESKPIDVQTLSSESFNACVPKMYVVVENRRDTSSLKPVEEITNCFVYRVEYLINQNTAGSTQTIKRTGDEVTAADIETKLKSVFNVGTGNTTEFFERDEATGVLKSVSAVEALTSYTFTKQYVCITYTDTTKMEVKSFRQLQIMFYIYDDADGTGTADKPNVDIRTSQTTRYYLSSLDAYVKKEAASALTGATDLTITYYEFAQDGTPMSQQTMYISLNENVEKHFYVMVNATVGESKKMFYFDMTFNFIVNEGILNRHSIVVKKEHPTETNKQTTDVVKTSDVLSALQTILNVPSQSEKVPDGATNIQLYREKADKTLEFITSDYIEATDLEDGCMSGVYGLRYTRNSKTAYVFTNITLYYMDESRSDALNLTIGVANSSERTFSLQELNEMIFNTLGLKSSRNPETDPEPIPEYPYVVTETTYRILGYREYVANIMNPRITDVNQITVGVGQTTRKILVGIEKVVTTTTKTQESVDESEPQIKEKIEVVKTYTYYDLTLKFVVPESQKILEERIEVTKDKTASQALKEQLVNLEIITEEQKETAEVQFISLTDVVGSSSGLKTVGGTVADADIKGDTRYLAKVTTQNAEEEKTETLYSVAFIVGVSE